MLLGTALAGAHERAWVDSRGILLAVTAYLLSVFLLWRGLPWHRRPDGVGHARFGAANVVTSLRLSLVIWLLACATAEAYFAPGVGMILVIVLAATLDAIDGPLARASGLDSAYGARFDMETDALLVLVLSVMVWRAGVAGPWVLASGLLRYGFVALAWWLPWMARALPPSLRRKAVCVLQILLLIVALLPGLTPGLATASALIGLLTLVVSFGVDVAWLAARRETSSKPLQGTPI
ncbi:MAG: CDP-alcohol phosphatidyltransferase family protein [Burkholderiaceae bacterium]